MRDCVDLSPGSATDGRFFLDRMAAAGICLGLSDGDQLAAI
ncbi:hypothetical protein BF49_3803 [Bradyrhizobium sp.]|nr:hypothetical protein BF49_3803 [Bradyrhizobium sp.]